VEFDAVNDPVDTAHPDFPFSAPGFWIAFLVTIVARSGSEIAPSATCAMVIAGINKVLINIFLAIENHLSPVDRDV
jgi:hypothetical protein